MRNGSTDTEQGPLLCVLREQQASDGACFLGVSVCRNVHCLRTDSTARSGCPCGKQAFVDRNLTQSHYLFNCIRSKNFQEAASAFQLNQFMSKSVREDISHGALSSPSTQPSSKASAGELMLV